jgi:cell wall-associated NlpC family hydrolase
VQYTWTFDPKNQKNVTSQRIVISQNQGFTGFRDANGTSNCDTSCVTRATSDNSDRITVAGNTASFTQNVTSPGQTYWWKVRVNGAGGATWSETRSFTIAGSKLSAKVDSFVNKWNGKGTDFDGAYGYQCVDLMRQFLKDVLGISSALPTSKADNYSAYSIFANANDSRFTKIYNSPSVFPQKGDIIFFNKTSGNQSGHVAIFLSNDGSNAFTSFDQNASGKLDVPRKVPHKYTADGGFGAVAGWLHPN